VYIFFPSFSYFITWRISRYRKATGEPSPLEVLNFHESDKMASKQITAWFPALFPLPLFPVTVPSRLCAWVPVNSRSQIHAPFSLSSHLDSFLFSRLLRICFVAKRKRIDEKLRFQAQISIATKPIPISHFVHSRILRDNASSFLMCVAICRERRKEKFESHF